ncbi:MAG: M3 family oligoendopeptidase, partial [Candidatus Izemoplasmataceae bacterium]
STNRDMRRRASKATSSFLQENEEKLDKLYDDLVKVRTEIAKKLGYKNFVELAYNRWGRVDYGPEDVANYRKQVFEHVVPLNTELTKRKQKRLNLDPIYHYDLSLEFDTGNPKPKGDKDWMVKRASTMYQEMSQETDEFFTFMKTRNLLDLEARKGKAGGGYCTFIANYDSPFIFSNFNGTKGDVDVLTHEAGHAFQMYMSRHHEVPEYLTSSPDVMEIHSMSMEFFAWPWINLFFEEDTEKYKFSHLTHALMIISYGVAIDEFQHVVYENPDMTIEARKKAWLEIDKKYFPYKVYDDNPYLENGNGWQSVMHIFVVPFYMIDYTLAQLSAFQYWVRSRKDHETAWKSYLTLCKAGGSDSFLGLHKLAELKSPFEDGTLKAIIPEIKKYLDSIDDTKL